MICVCFIIVSVDVFWLIYWHVRCTITNPILTPVYAYTHTAYSHTSRPTHSYHQIYRVYPNTHNHLHTYNPTVTCTLTRLCEDLVRLTNRSQNQSCGRDDFDTQTWTPQIYLRMHIHALPHPLIAGIYSTIAIKIQTLRYFPSPSPHSLTHTSHSLYCTTIHRT